VTFRCIQSFCAAWPAPMASAIHHGERSPSVTSRVTVERLRLVDLPEIAGLWRSIWRWLRVGSMLDESILREKAREAIRSGMLPVGKPDRTFGGQGSGVTCAICGDQVKRDQLELEIEFNRHGVMPGLDRYHLHVRCFAAWELERTKVDSTSI
jgi:hypothetical protein